MHIPDIDRDHVLQYPRPEFLLLVCHRAMLDGTSEHDDVTSLALDLEKRHRVKYRLKMTTKKIRISLLEANSIFVEYIKYSVPISKSEKVPVWRS